MVKYYTGEINHAHLGTNNFHSNYLYSEGLFHRAIGESGSVLAEWALTQNMESIEEPCKKFAEFTGCPLEPYEDLLHCLRNIPAENLIKAYRQFKVFSILCLNHLLLPINVIHCINHR